MFPQPLSQLLDQITAMLHLPTALFLGIVALTGVAYMAWVIAFNGFVPIARYLANFAGYTLLYGFLLQFGLSQLGLPLARTQSGFTGCLALASVLTSVTLRQLIYPSFDKSYKQFVRREAAYKRVQALQQKLSTPINSLPTRFNLNTSRQANESHITQNHTPQT